MDHTVTARGTGAGGLATPAARWALVFAWLMGAVKALVDGQFNPQYVTLPVACLLCLVAAVVLTRREDLPLSGVLATVVTALVLTAMILALSVPPDRASIWQLQFGATLLALLFVRGDLVHAVIGAALHSAIFIVWALWYSMPVSWLLTVLTAPCVVYFLAVTWLFGLRRVVMQERTHRSEAAEHVRQTRAEREAARRIGRELALVRAKTGNVLALLRDGAPLDKELRGEIAVVGGEIRDRLRSPRLQHPELNRAISALRAGGTSVNVLAEDSESAPELGDRAAEQIAAVVRDEAGADSLVLTWNEPERVSIVARHGDRSERHIVEVLPAVSRSDAE